MVGDPDPKYIEMIVGIAPRYVSLENQSDVFQALELAAAAKTHVFSEPCLQSPKSHLQCWCWVISHRGEE